MRLPRLALLVTLLVPAFVALPVAAAPQADPRPVPPEIRNRQLAGVNDAAAEKLRQGSDPRGRSIAGRGDLRVLTARTRAEPFELVGVTWEAADAADPGLGVQVRTKAESGGWSDWSRLAVTEDETPDDTTGLRGATEPTWVGDSDGVQVAVTSEGALPDDLELVMIDPGESPADADVTSAGPAAAAAAATPMPDYISREQWGADPDLRKDDPDYGDTIVAGFIHHTVTAVDYEPADSPGIVRSIYAYHTSNGWDDIGYNFLVDQYGQLFEGRWGGVDKPVVGGHTGGKNTNTFGVAALGDFEERRPTAPLLRAIERVAAFKLDKYGRDPQGTVHYEAPDGATSTFDVLSGHRDVGSTLCPGEYLYPKLPVIRRNTAQRVDSDRTPAVSGSGDFDGDGYQDLVIRVPGEGIGSRGAAGIIDVVPGSSSGADPQATSAWHQGTDGVTGAPESGDRFGWTTAAGDFNDDGRDDLAVGVPFEMLGSNDAGERHGAVHVLYGSSDGLSTAGAEWLTIRQTGEPKDGGDRFGYSLAAGDTDGDGADELAVGAVGGGTSDNGAVIVYAGDTGGLVTDAPTLFSSGRGLPADPTPTGDDPDHVGHALAMGDTDGDGFDDLAIGAPAADQAGRPDAGAVFVVRGSETGLDPTSTETFHQATPGVPGAPEPGDAFGVSVALGQLDGAFGLDLAVGVGGEGVGGLGRAGMMNVLYAVENGLTGSGADGWHQASDGVPGANEAGDRFGDPMLAAGDYDADGYDDLAVSVRAEDIGSARNAGAALVFRGGPGGLRKDGIRSWHQSTPGVPGGEEAGDQLGSSLAALDLDGDGSMDLAVGVRGENRRAGRVVLLPGSPSGLGPSATHLTQRTAGIPGVTEPGDLLGY